MTKPELCVGCPLYDTEGYAVGEGPEDAKVCLLGEALGAEEALRGRPFVGGAGRTLNMLLHKAGLQRSQFYVTNVVRCRPPGNRTPTDHEAQECMTRHGTLEFLQRFNLVVLLGNTALHAITGKLQIMKWRGSVFEHGGLKVLPTLHPAAIMRQQDMLPAAIADLDRIHKESWTKAIQAVERDYNLHADATHVDQLYGAPIAFDVETNSLDPSPGSVTIIGLCGAEGRVFVLDDLKDPYTRAKLQMLFNSPGLKIGQNITFDISHLEANGISVKPPIFDTMIAHHLILSDVPNDLGFIASLYTDMPFWKDQAGTNLRWYNANDVDATFRIYETLSKDLARSHMQRIMDTSMAVIPVLAEMKRLGVRVDTKKQLQWRIALERTIAKKEVELAAEVKDPLFNWRSPKQLAELLYGKLKLQPIYGKHSTNPTTNEEALEELYDQTANPLLDQVLTLRRLGKLSGTYFSTEAASTDGKVHSEYLLHGTATGRLASRDPNLQNVPKGPARAIYIPDEGKCFLSADYSQIEMRIAALLAGERTLLEAFDRGEDVHKRTAAAVYHIPQDQVTKAQRDFAKLVVYGLGYGRGARSLAKGLKVPIRQAERFIDEYFSQFPKIMLWRQDLAREAQANGYLANPFGRRRYFFGELDIPKAYNFKPQSTGADILLESLVLLYNSKPPETRLVLTVHDQVLIECPIETADKTTAWAKEVMERPIDVLKGYQVPVSILRGMNWAECD